MILPTFLSLYHRARRIWVSALLNLNTLIAFNIGMITSTERLTSINIDAEVDWEQCVFRRSIQNRYWKYMCVNEWYVAYLSPKPKVYIHISLTTLYQAEFES